MTHEDGSSEFKIQDVEPKNFRIRCTAKDLRFALDCERDLEYLFIIIGSACNV